MDSILSPIKKVLPLMTNVLIDEESIYKFSIRKYSKNKIDSNFRVLQYCRDYEYNGNRKRHCGGYNALYQ